jgi:hypothetical protein
MKKYSLVFILLIATIFVYAQENNAFDKLTINILEVSKSQEIRNKPDKLAILYNSYTIIRDLLSNRAIQNEADNYYTELKKNNPNAFRTITISMFDKPIPIFNQKIRPIDIDKIINQSDTVQIK